MNHISTTPFGSRPVTARLVQAAQDARAPAPLPQINKWEVFRQICTARHAYDLTNRDLTVLNALLTFHQGSMLSDDAPLVVFPSNRTLSERAHGMAESTLRRHLAALVAAGLVLRQDSPNGKRYAHKSRDGEVLRAFGFNLRPILTRAKEITHNAQEAEAVKERVRVLRTDISLMKRDALKFTIYGQENEIAGDWDALLGRLMSVHKLMRRKLSLCELQDLAVTIRALLDEITSLLQSDTEKTGGSDMHFERQLQNSNKDSYESEDVAQNIDQPETTKAIGTEVDSCQRPQIPLALIIKACDQLKPYAENGLYDWGSLVRASEFVRGMMGITQSGYMEACKVMGRENTAITTACILQRIDQIRNPGGYLRSLARKAEAGRFSVAPMVMALLNAPKS